VREVKGLLLLTEKRRRLGGREGEERKKRNQDGERRRGHDGEIQVLIVTRLEIQREKERERSLFCFCLNGFGLVWFVGYGSGGGHCGMGIEWVVGESWDARKE
jgi:hypothetical protein